MFFSSFRIVIPILAAFIRVFDGRTKRIFRILFNRFKNGIVFITQGRGSFFLVGIKYNVYSIRHVIGIYSHTFKIMSSINKNTNLRISISFKIKISNASSEFDSSVFLYACKPIRANIICISNHQTTGIKTFWICKFLFNTRGILIEFIVFDCSNFIPLKRSIFWASRRT